MSGVGFDYLFAIQQECVSNTASDPQELKDWIASIGIDPDGFDEFVELAGKGGKMAAQLAQAMEVPPETFMAALVGAGFELGVRYQQSREMVL